MAESERLTPAQFLTQFYYPADRATEQAVELLRVLLGLQDRDSSREAVSGFLVAGSRACAASLRLFFGRSSLGRSSIPTLGPDGTHVPSPRSGPKGKPARGRSLGAGGTAGPVASGLPLAGLVPSSATVGGCSAGVQLALL